MKHFKKNELDVKLKERVLKIIGRQVSSNMLKKHFTKRFIVVSKEMYTELGKSGLLVKQDILLHPFSFAEFCKVRHK